jgi:hypothetical protein
MQGHGISASSHGGHCEELGSPDIRGQKKGLSITRCIIEFGQIEGFGKKPSLLDVKTPPQDMGSGVTSFFRSLQPCLAKCTLQMVT